MLSWHIWLPLPWPELHRPYPVLEPSRARPFLAQGPSRMAWAGFTYVRGFLRTLTDTSRLSGEAPRLDQAWMVKTLGVACDRNPTQIRFKMHSLAQLLI